MASTRMDKYKDKRSNIDELNNEGSKKKVNKSLNERKDSKEKILEDLGIDTSFGLDDKPKTSTLEKLNKVQEEVYHTQEMRKISEAELKKEGSVSKIMDTMKQDLPLNESTTNIKPAKRTQVSNEYISAKERYRKEEKKEIKQEKVIEKPKLIINDNTKKKEMPKTSATKVMGIDDILEVKAQQNNKKVAPKKASKKKKINTDAMMLKVCLVVLAVAIIAIILVLVFK